MAGTMRTIGTKITLSGEKEFNQAIRDIGSQLAVSNSELRKIQAQFAQTGNAENAARAASVVYNQQLALKNQTLQQLKERMEAAKNETQKLSEQGMRNLQIAINDTEADISKLEAELKKLTKETGDLGRDSRRAGDQLENNLGEAAEETENKLQKLARSVNDTLGGMKKLQRVSVAVDIVRGAWDFAESLTNYVQGAVEDGMSRAKIQYNIGATGGNVGQSMILANQYAAIFGDQNSSYEAIANLAAAGYKDESLLQMSKYIGGAAIRFQDTLKIESLADSLQETLSEGVLTGQISELINRLAGETGISVEQVNKQLAEAKKKGNERVALEAYLSNAGLDTYYDNFIKQNEGLVESATALQEFNTALNDLAVTTLPLLTPAIEGTAELFNSLNTPVKEFIRLLTPNDPNADPYEQDRLAIEAENKKLYGQNWTPQQAEGAYDKYETQPKSIFQAAGDAYLGGLDWLANTGWFGNLVANALGRPAVAGGETLDETAGMKPNAEMSQFVQGYYEQLAEAAAGRNTQIRNRVRQKGIVPAPQIETNYNEGVLEAWDASVNNWTVVEDVESKAAEAEEAAKTGGKNIGTGLVTGLQSQSLRLLAAAAQQRALLERVWEDPIKPTVVVGYQMAGPVKKEFATTTPIIKPATIMLNNRQVGEAVFSYFNGRMGAEIE